MKKDKVRALKKGSLLGKMLLQILLPGFLVLALGVTVILSVANTEIRGLTNENLMAKTEAISFEMSDFFAHGFETVSQMSISNDARELCKTTGAGKEFKNSPAFNDCFANLQDIAKLNSAIEISWVADYDESQYILSNGDMSGLSNWIVSERPWYPVAMESDGVVITSPYLSTTGSIVVTIVARLTDGNSGDVLGFAAIDITTDELGNIIGNHALGQNGFYAVVTEDGVVIHHPNKDYIGASIGDTDLAELSGVVASGEAQDISFTANGTGYKGYMATMPYSGWKVVSCLPTNEYLADVTSLLITFIIVGLAIVLLLGVLVITIAGRTTKPLKKLSAAAEEIANGRFDVSIETKSLDETGQVSEALKKTVARLSDYVNYIDEITRVLNEMAEGKLNIELQYDYTGDFSKIKNALENVSDKLIGAMGSIENVANQVAAGAEQVSTGAQALSSGTTEQASAIEELSVTIDDISDKVQNTAENAVSANRKTASAVEEIRNSNEKMVRLSEAMSEINASSNEIGRIIKTIEDIAFQTNILALNAAVEAARAGEAGKGFAVVADEVRNLASKSAEAAKDTTELIQASMTAVAKGTTLTDEAASSLELVVESARAIEETTQMISLATNDQATAIAQVVTGIQQISDVVQNNSATSEESAASSEELTGQAVMLKNLVSQFKL